MIDGVIYADSICFSQMGISFQSSRLLVCRDRYLPLLQSQEKTTVSATLVMLLADHMHAAPHAEQHDLEVCQYETPAVFTSATLPGCTQAFSL